MTTNIIRNFQGTMELNPNRISDSKFVQSVKNSHVNLLDKYLSMKSNYKKVLSDKHPINISEENKSITPTQLVETFD
ncbi:hypothetical protein GW796_10645 [archaeon]|nr:hypothetical protein [archaeon]NCQ52320.1 hypothetical protein [archaeon]